MLYFVNGLNSNLTSNLSSYITSDFSSHSLLTVISVVTSVMSAASLMPIAKVLNLWDRTLGICIMLLIAIIGLIMMACCHDVVTYCAANVSSSHHVSHCWKSYRHGDLHMLSLGILDDWIYWYNILRRCCYLGYVVVAQSRYRFCLYFLSEHNHRVCRLTLVESIS